MNLISFCFIAVTLNPLLYSIGDCRAQIQWLFPSIQLLANLISRALDLVELAHSEGQRVNPLPDLENCPAVTCVFTGTSNPAACQKRDTYQSRKTTHSAHISDIRVAHHEMFA